MLHSYADKQTKLKQTKIPIKINSHRHEHTNLLTYIHIHACALKKWNKKIKITKKKKIGNTVHIQFEKNEKKKKKKFDQFVIAD